MRTHQLPITVYLEDTDAQGIVYHANYLKYCERGRTEFLRANGYTLDTMQAQGVRFVVFEMKLRFHHPAHLLEDLDVFTEATRNSEYRLTFKQAVHQRGCQKPVFTADTVVVTIDSEHKLCPLPEQLLEEQRESIDFRRSPSERMGQP
ncbi:MAG TPA: YbgC/FadM family acyl-CoA thioesterase [Polyangiaceae bacterium]